MTIRHYRKTNDWGVILPRGGGVKRFATEKEAKQFALACYLFEDVWPSDEPDGVETDLLLVAHAHEDEDAHASSEEDV